MGVGGASPNILPIVAAKNSTLLTPKAQIITFSLEPPVSTPTLNASKGSKSNSESAPSSVAGPAHQASDRPGGRAVSIKTQPQPQPPLMVVTSAQSEAHWEKGQVTPLSQSRPRVAAQQPIGGIMPRGSRTAPKPSAHLPPSAPEVKLALSHPHVHELFLLFEGKPSEIWTSAADRLLWTRIALWRLASPRPSRISPKPSVIVPPAREKVVALERPAKAQDRPLQTEGEQKSLSLSNAKASSDSKPGSSQTTPAASAHATASLAASALGPPSKRADAVRIAGSKSPKSVVAPPASGSPDHGVAARVQVRLSYTADEATKAAMLSRNLVGKGFNVTSILIPVTPGRWPGVAYFFDSDRENARLIIRQMTVVTGKTEHARLSPRRPYPGPGTIEVSLINRGAAKSIGH
jgi:hypothetical protein